MTNTSSTLVHRNCADSASKQDATDINHDDHNNNRTNFTNLQYSSFARNSLSAANIDKQKFIVTETFTDEEFNRPDVPEWFKFEVLKLDDKHNDDIIDENNFESKQQDDQQQKEKVYQDLSNGGPFLTEIVWRNVFTMLTIHLVGVYGWYLFIRYGKIQSLFWAHFVGTFSGIGILAGAHRLWTHRSYKAHWLFRVILMIGQTMALQNDIYEWARDHRAHHKFSDTNADPHNSRRGFFFAHVGWLLCRKHPEVKEKGTQIDMSDVWADPIVRFQRRFYIPLVLLIWGFIPVYVPYLFWGESFYISLMGNFFRYIVSLNHAWMVNSAAHLYGYRFYERNMNPRENYLVTYLSLGEGYHNYHHTFPWDYSASEHGWRDCFNIATLMIDIASWMGLASDRRVVSKKVIQQRVNRTGDMTIIPSMMDQQRKPKSMLLELIIGTFVNGFMVWLTILLNFMFRVELN